MQPNLLSIFIYVLSKGKTKLGDDCVLILVYYSHSVHPGRKKFCMRKAFILLISLGCKQGC